MVKRQLELSLVQSADCRKPRSQASQRFVAKHRRQNRTRWWFDRMRQVVDDAQDRRPDPLQIP